MKKIKIPGKIFTDSWEQLIHQFKEHRKPAVTLILILFVISLFLCLRMDKAFEYKMDATDSSDESTYDLQNGICYRQKIDVSDGKLSGVSLKISTHEQINKGELSVTLNEDGVPIRNVTSNIEYFVDNAYQKFYFKTPVTIKNNCAYDIQVTADYTAENVISVWSQTEGEDLFSDGNPVNGKSLCCRFLLVHTPLKNKILFVQIFFVLLIGLFLLLKMDFTGFQIGKALLAAAAIIVALETAISRVFPYIPVWAGHKIAWLIIDLAVIYLLVVYLYSPKKEFTVEKFFLVSAIPLMMIYLVLMLPWSAPDTNRHFQAAYRQANMLMGKEEWVIRADDAELYNAAWTDNANSSMGGIATVLYYKSLKAHNTELIPWPSPDKRMEYYSIFCYLPEVLGICLGRILGLGSVCMVYLARLFISIVYILACYHAIKTTPVGKFIFAAIPLLPMSLMIGTAISYDPMVLLATLNFLACSLKLSREPESKPALIECIVWAFLIGAVKGGGYLVLLPMVFIFFGKEKRRALKNGGKIVLAGIVSVVLCDVILPFGSSFFQFGEEASGTLSTSYALANPLEYLHMCVNSYLNSMDALMINMGGTALCWLEQTIPAAVIVSLMLIIGTYCIYEKDAIRLGQREKWVFGFIIFLEFILTPAMLMSSTTIGSNAVMGLQGRYYLPVLPLIIMILTKYKLHDGAENVTTENALRIKSSCFRVFALLSCLSVYYMLRLYLTR